MKSNKPSVLPLGMKYSQTGGDRARDSKGKHLDEYRGMQSVKSRRNESKGTTSAMSKLWKKAKAQGKKSIKGLKL
jgi:hypothetical protein